MGSISFAFSVHHFISTVGADAGFAAIIGLAILVLLYFAHARETANLREQTDEASHRVGQLEARLAQLVRQQSSGTIPPTPAPPPPGTVPPVNRPPASALGAQGAGAAQAPAPSSGQAGTASGARSAAAQTPAPATHAAAGQAAPNSPAPPAGTAAPALSAATRLIPASEAQVGPSAGVEAPSEATMVSSPPPTTVGGGANGGGAEAADAAPTEAEPIYAGRGAEPERLREGAVMSGAPSARSQAASRSAAARPVLPPRAPRKTGASRRFLVLMGALLAIGVIAVLVIVTSSGGSPTSSSASHTSNAPAANTPFNPASVTVAVLNGTATSGLAHRIALRLGAAGYKQGTIATASDQTRSATVVAYTPGHRRDALQVASSLKLGSASVQPVDASTQAIACPRPNPCQASVFVTVGSDIG